MRNITEKVQSWLGLCRKNSTASHDSTSKKEDRAPWLGRLTSVAFDLGFYSMMFYVLMGVSGITTIAHSSAVLIVTFPLYYLVVEYLFGRSIGKMFMGYKMSLPDSVNPRGFLLVRGMMRFVPMLNILMLLSWRRTTLLDLLSYTRVKGLHESQTKLKEKRKNRKKQGRPTKSSSYSTLGSETASPHDPSPPNPAKGFDPLLLDR